MSLGQDNQNNGKLFILKITTKGVDGKEVPPAFSVSEKNQETGKWAVTGSVSSVSGELSRIDIKDNEWEGQHYNTVSLYFKDSVLDETYLVDTKVNMLSRSIFNSLLNLENYDEVKLGLYLNKKGYAAVAVRSHGDMVNWKYSLDEQPKPEEVKFKGKIQRDYTEVDSFFIEKLRDLAGRLGETAAPVKKETFAKSPEASDPRPKVKKKEVVKDEALDSVTSSEDDDSIF